MLKQRSADIKDKLEELDKELENSKELKENAINSIEEAKKRAKDVKKSISLEAKNIASRIEDETLVELVLLENSYVAKKDVEQKRLTSVLIKEITDEIFTDESIVPTNDEISDIIIKKVS